MFLNYFLNIIIGDVETRKFVPVKRKILFVANVPYIVIKN